jgi:nucleoside-diphosphate-sugar epimerase
MSSVQTCVVTGAAGFIGSHLCEKLLALGREVVGIDAFIDYYPRAIKEQNLAACLHHPNFRFHEIDLRRDALDGVLARAEVVYHLAAMAGLTQSWIKFDDYLSCNVQATQRLLEAVRRSAAGLRRFVYASTSSVYGLYASGDESLPTKPVSPYGVTKLAGENLCRAYLDSYELPVVILRFFSVYGPRQRPDMGYHRFIQALLQEEPVVVYGDGQQARGNTFVADCVQATLEATEAAPGEVFNVGGGETANVWEILEKLEAISGRTFVKRREPARAGDQRFTAADTRKLLHHFGWSPRTSLREGLTQQWEWQRQAWTNVGRQGPPQR